MAKTAYTKCPHLQANPEKFDDRSIWRERLSNRHVWTGCHDCLKLMIEERWAKEAPELLEHMRRVNLITVEGCRMYAPEGLLKHVIEPKEMPNGEIVMMPGWRINDEYKVAIETIPETVVETIPETIPEPEVPAPDATELRAFLEPVVSVNEKFVALWKQGKTGPLIGVAMRAAAGKYEGKYIEKTLKEIVDGTLKADVAENS